MLNNISTLTTNKGESEMKQYKTEDGYVFDLQDDGSLTDGDMTFDSLEELKKHVDVYEVKSESMDGERNE
jgi:hypothetical protein|tara:strand:- start:698 stop:907 length:210 start_codon:yes stop_codon:yes gene_type:complete